MLVASCLLLLAAWFGGMAVIIRPVLSMRSLQCLLTFSGGYLLAIVWLHLIPELFVSTVKPLHVGAYIMTGFFVQCFIESFSAGVAHSHSITEEVAHRPIHAGKIFSFISFTLLHALLDGTMLAHNTMTYSCLHVQKRFLWGMLLHKFLEAFALMNLLNRSMRLSLQRSVAYLIIFSIASPIGLWLRNYLHSYLTSSEGTILLAIVTGNLLYISIAILFEANVGHTLSQRSLGIGLLGAGLVALMEFLC